MTPENAHTAAAKQTIDALIQTATTFDVDALDQIYHDDMSVVMLGPDGQANKADKETFKNIFKAKKEAGDPPMNTWAEYHHIEANADTAHVLLSRKNNLNGQDMHLTLSIDLVYENSRWQVIREVIFLRPDTD